MIKYNQNHFHIVLLYRKEVYIMKRMIAILLCLLLVFSAECSVAAIVSESRTPEKAASSENNENNKVDIEEEEDPLAGEKPVIYDLTPKDKEKLLNSAALSPVVTNYEPLDSLVRQILSEIITEDMSTYEKTLAIYNYIIKDAEYINKNEVADDLYYNIGKTVKYKSIRDRNIVCDAYGFLVLKRGICNHFSSAFMVISRAIGLESYIATCCNSASLGLGNHISVITHLDGGYYFFDPSCSVVKNERQSIEKSVYFCTPFKNNQYSEYCNKDEIIADYFEFETTADSDPLFTETIEGKTEGDIHFSFGTYPQSRVTDRELIAALNRLLDSNEMQSYRYSSGNLFPGSQTESDYMMYADISYNNEKYRAVTFSSWRPKFSYYSSEQIYTFQSMNRYYLDSVYWFKFDPIEWRLTDGDTLLVADLVIDSQPFNKNLYEDKNGKEINGKKYYFFSDKNCTIPANEWETSYIRKWLNEQFYDTAFTEEEKHNISETLIHNYGYYGYFDYEDTVDRIFLLSDNEVFSSPYYLSDSSEARVTQSSDYAKCQGVSYNHIDPLCPTAWMLRTPNVHSDDITFVNAEGVRKLFLGAAATMCGIRPALRVKNSSFFYSDSCSAPHHVSAMATDTGELTVKASICNGADGYLFYRYIKGSDTPEEVLSSENGRLVDRGLTPGTTYIYRVSSFKDRIVALDESELSDPIEIVCKTVVTPPKRISAVPSGTGKITVSYSPVDGADLYHIYMYINPDTMVECGISDTTSCVVTGLSPDTSYCFKVSSESSDSYESVPSKAYTVCICESFPPRPKNLTAKAVSTGSVELSWEPVQDGIRYYIYRYISQTDVEEIGTTTDTSFAVDGLAIDSTYYFKINAVSEDGSDVSAFSPTVNIKSISIPPRPENLKAQAASTGSIKLSWDNCEGAERYNIYKYISSTDLEYIGTTESTSYLVSDLAIDSTYYFKVEATSDNEKQVSEKSYSVSAKCESIPPVPRNAKAVAASTGTIRVLWDESNGADHYNIYQFISATDLKLLGSTKETYYDVTGLSVGIKYFFKVEAVSADGKDISAKTNSVNAVCESIPAIPQNVNAETSAKPYTVLLSWDPVDEATGYEVYRYMSAETGYSPVGTTVSTSYEYTGIQGGTSGLFVVLAFKKDGDNILKSKFSSSVRGTATKLSSPQNVTAKATESGEITVSWDKLKGADRYNVYRYDPDEKRYVKVGSTDKTIFSISQLKANTIYTFRIEPVTVIDNIELLGERSAIVSCKAIAGPEAPDEFSVTVISANKVQLDWSLSSGATRYDIYVCKKPGDDFILVGSTSGQQYIVDTSAYGTETIFRVYPVTEKNDEIFTGTPTEGTIPEKKAEILLGDTDGDGRITIIDVTIIQKKLASIPVAVYIEEASDVDHDGSVTIVDATYIQKYLAKLPSIESIGKEIN